MEWFDSDDGVVGEVVYVCLVVGDVFVGIVGFVIDYE